MNNLIPFTYNSKQIRVIENQEGSWFIAKDVCEVLEIANSRDSVSRLDDDEKGVVSTDTLGGEQEMQVVNEAGLYTLILGSRKPEAKQFKRWITHVVIPSIRKHGMYARDELLDNPDLMIEVLKELKREREEKKLLQTENNLLAGKTLTWTSRKVLEAIVKAYGASIHLPNVNGFQEAWRDFKKELLYNYSINLNARISKQMELTGKKNIKTLDMIHDDELSKCISTAVALCKSHNVDISEILQKYAA